MTEDLNAPGLAYDIDDARQRLIGFVQGCADGDWHAAPLDGDPRPVGVIADHVADAYEYLARFITALVAGNPVDVNAGLVDDLNAQHAGGAGSVTAAHVVGHLRSSGDELITLVSRLQPEQLDLGDGLVRRLAVIAARHADSHRTEIEESLAAGG
jgi:hypothetical protein